MSAHLPDSPPSPGKAEFSAPVNAHDNEPDRESTCQKPCDPDAQCPECEGYWERMQREGYWDMQRHRWTDKGWHEITKLI